MKNADALPAEETLFLCRVNTNSWVRSLSAFAPLWTQRLIEHFAMEGAEFSGIAVPSVEGLLPYASPFSSHVVRRKDGLEAEVRGGLPIPGGIGLLLNLLYWMREPEIESGLGVRRTAGDQQVAGLGEAIDRRLAQTTCAAVLRV